MTPITLAEAMRDPRLFGEVFAAETFWTWLTVAKVLSGEELDERESALFQTCTGAQRVTQGAGQPARSPGWAP